MVETATKVFSAIFSSLNQQVVDNIFYESDGIIYISRLVEANYMKTAMANKTIQTVAQQDNFGADPGRALTLSINVPQQPGTALLLSVDLSKSEESTSMHLHD